MANPLVPLRIPSGWTVMWNYFTDINPKDFQVENYEHRWALSEDLLQVVNYKKMKIIDLGWYPAHQPTGSYRLVCLRMKIRLHN